jgi:hypothetical protein
MRYPVPCIEPDEQWLWSPEQLLRSPSAARGMQLEVELFLRAHSVQMLSNVCDNLPQLGPDTFVFAAVFLQRFYMRVAFQEFLPRARLAVLPYPKLMSDQDVIPAAIFLGTKAAERPVRLSDIVQTCLAREAKLAGEDESSIAAIKLSKVGSETSFSEAV